MLLISQLSKFNVDNLYFVAAHNLAGHRIGSWLNNEVLRRSLSIKQFNGFISLRDLAYCLMLYKPVIEGLKKGVPIIRQIKPVDLRGLEKPVMEGTVFTPIQKGTRF